MTASRLESGDDHGLILSMTNVCSSPISGTRCFKLGHRDDSVSTTIAPRELCTRIRIFIIGVEVVWSTHDSEKVQVYWLEFSKFLVALCRYNRQLSIQILAFSSTGFVIAVGFAP
jgi:hypothetical protein